jgi:hypothetical protein
MKSLVAFILTMLAIPIIYLIEKVAENHDKKKRGRNNGKRT